MTLIAILLVFLLEQLKAAPAERLAHWARSWAEWVERHLNAGERSHARLAWFLGVAGPAFLVAILSFLSERFSSLLSLMLAVLVLYGTLGFRQFSHFFTDIHLALRMGENERARTLLGAWRGRDLDAGDVAVITRLTIEEGIVSAYRYVFAPLFWFLVLGPAGALLYRLAVIFAEHWRKSEAGHCAAFAQRALDILDWLPVRLAAITFAIVGDFEDALYCWRTQAAQWPDASFGILLAAGAGALGLRLGLPVVSGSEIETRPELGLGDVPDIEHLQSAIGLVWRTVVLMFAVLLLMTLAAWLG